MGGQSGQPDVLLLAALLESVVLVDDVVGFDFDKRLVDEAVVAARRRGRRRAAATAVEGR